MGKGGCSFIVVLFVALVTSATVVAAPSDAGDPLTTRVLQLEAELDSQREARDRQAEAFDAAATRMEFANGVLIAFIAIAGLGGSLLAIRWVRGLAAQQVETQVTRAIREAGERVFEAEARILRDKYEEKFAEQYVRYRRLSDEP